ncbi:DHA2 family efflux MFS transporter permease subunit [Salidesulfovibrio onnuriiensis]|uniref:DHA2 family efflux MFS transporter permease subunit n=1 Tax=Salidesulfovibrio onnuriiensis TaxID=2583823 RepID=UPI0011C9F852|nr:DHA2 family efflux MFS transporter permease subunit [Salidesulfovibrio onnuriiensis]
MLKREDLIVLSVCFGAFISCLDSYIVNISLPEIATAFNTDVVSVSAVTVYYSLLMTCSMLVWGKAADRLGARRLFLAGYVVFTLSSLACGLASSLEMLVVARCVQGVGAASLFAIGMTIVALYVPPHMLGKAYGLVATSGALGLTFGAPLGGLITGLFDWRGVFLVNVPIGILAWMLTRQAVPRTEERNEVGKPFDIMGALLSSAALFSLVWAASACERQGWQSPDFLIFSGLAVALAVLFILQERRHSSPLVNPALFRDRGFPLAVSVGMILMFTLGGVALIIPFHLIWGKGLSVETAGLVMAMFSGVGAVLSPFTGRLADKVGAARLCLAAMVLGAGASLFFANTAQMPGLTTTFIFLLVFGLGTSLFFPGGNALIMQLAPREHKGTAGAVNATSRTLGMALGASIFAALLPHHGVTGELPPGAMFVPWTFAAVVLAVALLMCFPLVTDERRKKRELREREGSGA